MANIFLRFSAKLKQAAAGLSVHDRQIKIPNGSVCRSISKPDPQPTSSVFGTFVSLTVCEAKPLNS